MHSANKLEFEATAQFSKLLNDYLNEASQLKQFYKFQPSITAFSELIRDNRHDTSSRATLADELSKQYASLPKLHSAHKNIQRLRQVNCYSITTAHQPCLLTGPLYFIYKIISTIKLCRQLTETYKDAHFVPVYWLGSEDHDFEEINHLHLFNKTFRWETEANGAVGDLSTKDLKPILEQILELVGTGSAADHIRELINSSFETTKLYKLGFQKFVAQLFGDFGLVVIDPDQAVFKQQIKDVIRQDLFENRTEETVLPVIERLAEHYPIQAKPRRINFFYKAENIRSRIVLDESSTSSNELEFKVLDTNLHFTSSEMLNLIDSSPEKFSPNVMLRPLYQQQILPNLAYIGGPSEIAYWIELKDLFEHFEIIYPMLLLRNSAMILDKASQKKLARLNMDGEELFQETEQLINQYIKANSENEIDLSQEIGQLTACFGSIKNKANAIDSGLEQSVEAEFQKVKKGISNLEARFRRSEKRNQETAVNQIRALRAKLFPNDGLQERHDNFIAFYLREPNFFHDLLELFDPLSKQFYLLEE